jgi:hypothetical protein
VVSILVSSGGHAVLIEGAGLAAGLDAADGHGRQHGMSVDIAKRQADRIRVLHAIFDATDGTTSEAARLAPTIQERLGLSNLDLEAACDYLAAKGLIKPTAKVDEGPVYIAAQLTGRGLDEIEAALSSPSKPTRYLPAAASVVLIINSTLVGSPIQNASPCGRQKN